MDYRKYEGDSPEKVLSLYESVGWTNYTWRPEMLRQAYAHSLFALAAYEGEALIGVVRLVGDGASILYVQDLLVRPEYQRQGIGSELLRRALAQFPQVYQTVLLTDDTEKTRAFYQAMALPTPWKRAAGPLCASNNQQIPGGLFCQPGIVFTSGNLCAKWRRAPHPQIFPY